MPFTADDFVEPARSFGEHGYAVATTDGRLFRVLASKFLTDTSGDDRPWSASYQERVWVNVADVMLPLWIDIVFPWELGATAQECLEGTVRWIRSADERERATRRQFPDALSWADGPGD
jgi:hypothetical protein